MVKQKIPINEIPYKNVDSSALSVFSDRMIDGFLEKVENKLVFIKRPGLGDSITSIGSGLVSNGIKWWEGKKYCVVTNNSNAYILNHINGTYSKTLIPGLSYISNTTPVIFAEWGDDIIGHKMLMASGSKLCYIEDGAISACRISLELGGDPDNDNNYVRGINYSVGDILTITAGDSNATIQVTAVNAKGGVTAFSVVNSGTRYVVGTNISTYYDGLGDGLQVDITNIKESLVYVTDADAPTEVSHVCVLDRYAIVNKLGSSEWYYSEVNDLNNWSALGFENAEADPDIIKALLTNQEKLYVIGTRSTEIWYNDGVTPWQRYGVVSRGTLSPYSALFADNILYFIDSNKEFIRVINGQVQPISETFNKYIQSFRVVNDAIAMNITAGGRKFYVVTFPTEDKTLFYDYKNEYWGEWGKWNCTDDADYSAFLGIGYAYSPLWNKNLVTSRINDRIYDLSESNYMDDSCKIRTEKITGNTDYNIKNRKRSNYVRLSFQRGLGLANDKNTAPLATFKFRNDGNKVWSSEYQIDLGVVGDTRSTVELQRLGMYQSRQYSIVHTDNSPFMLIEAEEEVDVMTR